LGKAPPKGELSADRLTERAFSHLVRSLRRHSAAPLPKGEAVARDNETVRVKLPPSSPAAMPLPSRREAIGRSRVSLRLGPLAVLTKSCTNLREWQRHSHGGGNETYHSHKLYAASVIHYRSCRFATSPPTVSHRCGVISHPSFPPAHFPLDIFCAEC